MNEILAVFAGIGLAAACGFRVFAPLFIASLAANTGVDVFGNFNFSTMLGGSFHWLGSTPVTLALGVATALEIGSYYIPWLDNALDTLATPAAIVAGTVRTGAVMPDFMGDGFFKWILSTIAGGGSAAVVQGATVITRGASTATTGGAGNPVVSTAELGGSVLTAALAVLLPVLAAILVLVLFYFSARILVKFFRHRAKPDPAG